LVGGGLRVWRATVNGLSFDESFTAVMGRRSVSDLFSFLRAHDSHPPLDYLLRLPLARVGAPDLAMRAPSLVFSISALCLFGWWMRSRGWVGVVATALVAVGTFQLVYGGEARMYALLQLLGVAVAIVTESWLRRPLWWHPWAVGFLLLLALLDHVSGFLLGAGLVAVAGARSDRDAWRWRGALAGAGAAWAVVWGSAFLDQLHGSDTSWIPRTTIGGFVEVVARHVTFTEALAPMVFVMVVAGAVLLARADRVLGRLWWCVGALPFALAGAVGIFSSFLFDRTLSLASWAPPLAVAFLLGEVWRRSRPVGTAAAVIVVLAALASSVSFLRQPWGYDRAIARLERVVRPGDVVASYPARFGALVDWRIGVRGTYPATPVELGRLPDTDAFVAGSGGSGRLWLLVWIDRELDVEDLERCAPSWTDGSTRLLCLRTSVR
jgi:hypothetical protein